MKSEVCKHYLASVQICLRETRTGYIADEQGRMKEYTTHPFTLCGGDCAKCSAKGGAK